MTNFYKNITRFLRFEHVTRSRQTCDYCRGQNDTKLSNKLRYRIIIEVSVVSDYILKKRANNKR